MTAARYSPAMIELLVDQLSDRDRAILHDLGKVRVLSGAQLTRLHFHDLAATSRDRTRRGVLARLAGHDLVTPLDRAVGGARSGSEGHVYALGVAGQRAVPLLDAEEDSANQPARPRRPWTPGESFLKHTLAISELYVQLVEAQRAGHLTLLRFAAEAGAWWPDGAGGLVKPDASACVAFGDVEDSWFVEVERSRKSPETLRQKFRRYVDFAHAGQLGPDGVTPRVLVTVPHERRLQEIRSVLARLPPPADQLFTAVLFDEAVTQVVRVLRE
ncbi:replication-relaxation family protein [Frankia sp. BMG5.23]|uniref:replication-relaxation family protein n=1 Tax=Frankia sp. BMG5.23 TaxID=683305 RepID=UPI00046160EA|nr:replication-relaxation family protein [Frankia sp. BMG5.23]KDA44510.1 hypothetical protein BMG523Draft_00687 [Frankia sp. BMG5.23]